jgi:DNA-binding MarR family transcriptional regulator
VPGAAQTALSPTESAAWHGLLRAHASLVRELERELRAAHGLPLSWYDVLREVGTAPDGRIRMGELADRVMLTPPGLSGLVDRLERAHLIERRPCDGDGRGTYAVVTPAGMHRLEHARATHRDAIRRRYTSRLDDTELVLIGRLWQRVASPGRAG